MKYILILISFSFSNLTFSQTDINFFENITKLSIDEIDAQLNDLGYNLTRSDSAKHYYAWRNEDENGFTYQKGIFKAGTKNLGNGLASVSFKNQLVVKYITSEKEKYYLIQTSLNNSTYYLKDTPIHTNSGIKTKYRNNNIEVIMEKLLVSKEDGSLYTTTFIINNPK